MAFARWTDTDPWYVWQGDARDAPAGSTAAAHYRSRTVYVWHANRANDARGQQAFTYGELSDDIASCMNSIKECSRCSAEELTAIARTLVVFMIGVEENCGRALRKAKGKR